MVAGATRSSHGRKRPLGVRARSLESYPTKTLLASRDRRGEDEAMACPRELGEPIPALELRALESVSTGIGSASVLDDV
jgi:hypothetical protein